MNMLAVRFQLGEYCKRWFANTAVNKGHGTKLIAIHGMTPVGFQESGSSSKPRLSIQRNTCLLIVCCSCLSRQSFVCANTGTKLLLRLTHISAQIHEFALWLHMVIWKCYQHKNLWVIIFNNDFNELWRVQESYTNIYYLVFQTKGFFCPKQLSSKIGTQ